MKQSGSKLAALRLPCPGDCESWFGCSIGRMYPGLA